MAYRGAGDPLLGIVVNLYLFGIYFSFSTPKWSTECHGPSWYPKWEYIPPVSHGDPDSIFKNFSPIHMFFFDWFFHLCVIW